MRIFETRSFAGSTLGEFSADNDRPPRSAKFVATVGWSWGPGSSRTDRMWLSTDAKRNGWHLWLQTSDFDTGRPLFCRGASGYPYTARDSLHAAKELLVSSWIGEMEQGAEFGGTPEVYEEGLLGQADIDAAWMRVTASEGR